MEHGITWLSFLPGYAQMEAYMQTQSQGVLGSPLVLQHVFAAILVAFIVIFLAWRTRVDIARAGLNAVVPGPEISVRNVMEVVFEALYDQMKQIIGPQCARYFPVLATLTLFIFCSNLLGLVPGFTPPTDNWNTTFACGIFVFLYYNYHGLRTQGFGHIAHMANPTGQWWGWFLAPLMFPIELVSHIARPFSLGVRLAANMVGDHAVLLGFLSLVPILVPLPFMALGLIVSIIQTLVFILLSMIYIGLATAHGHDTADGHSHDNKAHA
ncbi:MAG: ATP synthase F0 subunit A [Deltaproteobacteria bacterium]|nr:MAG: ATP synthase F0 subunit A [Deltaproteobacteria bacterium]